MVTKTQALTIEHANAMPAATWHNLRMNDTTIEIPEGLGVSPVVVAKGSWSAREAANEFEDAMTNAQKAWEGSHPEPTPEEIAEREAFLAAEADATYGGTAQSAYQVNADAIEESRSLAMAFETGVGEETAAYLRYVAGDRVVIEASSNQVVDTRVVVSGVDGLISVAAIDVVAHADSTVSLSIVVDSPDVNQGGVEVQDNLIGEGEQASSNVKGLTGTTVRVFAGSGSHVNIVRTQTLDEGFTDLDDMGFFVDGGSDVQVDQTVLGAREAYTGLAADLRGDSSRIDIRTHYLGYGEQKRDFNYIVRHHGEKTECDLQANGVLAGNSQKTLRGTIDLIRGAKGAQGSENETVLLVDEGAKNKTVPVILCNEDDVAGNHGATIGHIRDEQMFYLASRGLSREAAERMFVSAIMEQAAIDAPDVESRAGVLRLGETINSGFTALFDE